MPRGNTEKIFPRALVLSGIRRLIDKLNYRAAFMVCRAQMVDMNILHDYNPTQFMASVPLFIDQVKDAAFIDEFLSRLRYAMESTLFSPPLFGSGIMSRSLSILLAMRMSRRPPTKIPANPRLQRQQWPQQITKSTESVMHSSRFLR